MSVEIKIFSRLVKIFIVEFNISFKFINHSFPDICLYDFFLFEDLALEVCPDILDTSYILQKSYQKIGFYKYRCHSSYYRPFLHT